MNHDLNRIFAKEMSITLKNHLCFLLILLSFSCSQQEAEPAKSSAKRIASFSFNTLNPAIKASIDSTQRLITATVPVGTDVTKLVPTISLSDKASTSPASGIAQNFSKPVTYTVTAEDGTRQSYTVNITVTKRSAKSIISFIFTTLSPAVVATVDSVKRTITAVVPAGTNLTALTPTVRISDGATISPNSGTAQDFSRFGFGAYTVTAEDGSSQAFTTTIAIISNQVAQGKTNATKPFVLKKALCRQETLFGEAGYNVKLYDADIACGVDTNPPISFFISKLEIGTFRGQGPYFFDAQSGSSTSFFGCLVVITKVTATTIEGKIKGGDTAGDKNIDGTFTATICN